MLTLVGALHTLFRIFNECGDDFSPAAWRACFCIIIRPSLSANQEHYDQCTISNGTGDSEKVHIQKDDWNRTAAIQIAGIASVISTNLNVMKSDYSFSETWHEFLRCLNFLLNRRALELSKAIFSGLVSILEEIEDIRSVSKTSVLETWELWKQNSPVSHESALNAAHDNQDALLAYLQCLSHIYRLQNPESQLRTAGAIIEELRVCVINASVGAYSTDTVRMTPVQQEILVTLKRIPATSFMVLSQVVSFATFLVDLPYDSHETQSNGRTYLALSKEAIEFLHKIVTAYEDDDTKRFHGMIAQALEALAIPIHLKYKWYSGGKAPSTWRKATEIALRILENCLPRLRQSSTISSEANTSLWEQVVRLIDGVVTADCDSCKSGADVLEDQDFDIDAFRCLQRLTVPVLGSPEICDSVRQSYAKTIFEGSLIHEPHPDDLARPGQELLDGLKNPHVGRTIDLPPTSRVKMSYVLLDELFSLVAVQKGSAERVRLAQAGAPYLILRAGLTLRTYIFDQPLRGRAPQPYSQKLEMLHILKKLTELQCEPKAISQIANVASANKPHLYRLYPFFTQALRIASKPTAWPSPEIVLALNEALDAVGQDFGI